MQADKNIVEEQTSSVSAPPSSKRSPRRRRRRRPSPATSRATAEQELEQQRIELERRRLEADVVTPAKANLEAKQLAAQAEAAKIIEDGKAQVEVFQRLTEQYQAAGDDGQRIFVLNMLPELVDKIVSTVNNVDIDRVAIVDNGGGQGGDSRPRVAAAGCGRLAHRTDRGRHRCRHSRLDAQRPGGFGAGFGASSTAGTGSLTSRPPLCDLDVGGTWVQWRADHRTRFASSGSFVHS